MDGGVIGSLKFSQAEDTAMGLFTRDIKALDDLFVHQLQDVYCA